MADLDNKGDQQIRIKGESLNEADVTSENRLKVDIGTASIGATYLVPPATFTADYISNQLNVSILTPASGNQIRVIGCAVLSAETSGFTIALSLDNKGIQEHYEPSGLGQYIPCNVLGGVDDPVKLTYQSEFNVGIFLIINYEEITP